ncbi:LysR family transcriptional regulator [Promicromonospora sp. CA-289599]|uniref:LysR family transcriptional regulator n=1 Tax=Promicromonospora sp. CA-289599 TaxID=3240014 RepID=UPI003D92A6EB
MGAGSPLSFKDSSGRESTTDLGTVASSILAVAAPWRVLRWRHGQAHYSGWHWSATTGGHVVYESRLELARLLLDTHDFIDRHATGGRHPSQFPLPLRDALRGLGARQRLERFVTLAHQPSLNQAARAHDCSSANLTTQLATLERATGGSLIQRRPRPLPVGPLTPLGQELCRQAQEHLGIAPILPTT